MSPLTVVTVVPSEVNIASVKMEKATETVSSTQKTTFLSPKDLASELEEERRVIMEIQKRIQMIYPTQAMLDAAKVHRTPEEKAEADGRSIYVGQVDYAVKDAELQQHFKGCGEISRVSIQRDKFSGRPKGFAYIEFASKEAVELALALNESLLNGRQIKVNAKRTNLPFHAIQSQQGQPGKIRPQMHKYTAVAYRHRNMSIDRRRPVPY